MQAPLLLALCCLFMFLSTGEGRSSGELSYCDVNAAIGSLDKKDKTNPMWWVQPPVKASFYTVRSGDGAGGSDPTSYAPGALVPIHIRVHELGKKYIGLVMYAVKSNGVQVGTWEVTPGKAFWVPSTCKFKAVVHSNADLKPIHTVLHFRAPEPGAGTLTFKVLIKQGEQAKGNFYWPETELTLTEGAPVTASVVKSEPGASCNQACALKNMACDLEATHSIDSKAKLTDAIAGVYDCRAPLVKGCGNLSPTTGAEGWCWYREPTCASASAPDACSFTGGEHDNERFCSCKAGAPVYDPGYLDPKPEVVSAFLEAPLKLTQGFTITKFELQEDGNMMAELKAPSTSWVGVGWGGYYMAGTYATVISAAMPANVKPRLANALDSLGWADMTRGWYDAQCQGVLNDYCRWEGWPKDEANLSWRCAVAGEHAWVDRYTEETTSPVPCGPNGPLTLDFSLREQSLGDHSMGSALADTATLTSKSVVDGVATYTFTRPMQVSGENYYQFSLQELEVPLIWAIGSTPHFNWDGRHGLNKASALNPIVLRLTARTREVVDLCAGNTCGNHGTCTPSTGLCMCDEGWTGVTCTTQVNLCTNIDCGANGNCETTTGLCKCTNGFIGPLCQNGPESCTDGKQNGQETGIDCGGPDCPACTTYHYVAGDWSDCSVSCGGGTRTRTVDCYDQAGNKVDYDLCADQHATPTEETCGVESCPSYSWTWGTWTECSKPCGSGEQSRTVSCTSSVGSSTVDATLCNGSTKPPTTQACNTNPCAADTYLWVTGPFSECPTCGGGERTRQEPECQKADGSAADPSMCPAADKPHTSEPCENQTPCVTGTWGLCPWTECTVTCGGAAGAMAGVQYRAAFCQDQAGSWIDSSLCSSERPVTELEGCNPQPCDEPYWMSTRWSACVNGVSHRTSHCHATDGSNAPDSLCDAKFKPLSSVPCVENQCPRVVLAPTKDPGVTGVDDIPQLSDARHASASTSSLSTVLTALTLGLIGSRNSGISTATSSSVVLALITLLALVPSSQAHNWVIGPSRSTRAAVAKPCQRRVNPDPHLQVGPGQEFHLEWTHGHGQIEWGSVTNTYFVMVKEEDYEMLHLVDIKILEDYIADAPASAHLSEQKFKKTFVGFAEHEGTAWKREIKAGDPLWIERDNVMHYKGTELHRDPATFRQFEYHAHQIEKDVRVEYHNEKLPWIMWVARFGLWHHFPEEWDISTFRVPSNAAPGNYHINYFWQGYRDCIDVNVQPSTVAQPWGALAAEDDPKSFVKLDHCEFTYVLDPSWWGCKKMVAMSAQECIDRCASDIWCMAVQAVRWNNPAGTLPFTVNLPFKKFTDLPEGAEESTRGGCSARSIHDRRTCSDVQTRCDPATLGGQDGDYFCYGLWPWRNQDEQVAEEYIIATEPEDPKFYNTCWIKVQGGGFTNLPEQPKKLPQWHFGDKCISCDEQARIRDLPLEEMPDWQKLLIDDCEQCDYPNSG